MRCLRMLFVVRVLFKVISICCILEALPAFCAMIAAIFASVAASSWRCTAAPANPTEGPLVPRVKVLVKAPLDGPTPFSVVKVLN